MKKKIFVRGPVLSQSGYGEQARFALRALRSREDLYDIYIQPIKWGSTGWVWEQNEFRMWMDNRIGETQALIQQKQLEPDASIMITIPNEFEKLCPINIGYTAGIETTKVSPIWLQKGNEMDKIIVVSNHAKNTYINTVVSAKDSNGNQFPYKLQTPVDVVSESTPRADPEPIEEISLDYDFNFLMISQISERKNFQNSLKWWVEEFVDKKVGLVLKCNMVGNSVIDMEYVESSIKSILSKYPDRKCKVYLLHGDLTPGQMTGLYNNDKIKALINISHGEGFGLPLFEAAREGLPIVAIPWSGHLDFLVHGNKKYFADVDYTIQPVQPQAHWKGVIESDSMWAFADQGSYKMKLREVHKKHRKYKKLATDLMSIIEKDFSDEKLYSDFVESVNSMFDNVEHDMVVL